MLLINGTVSFFQVLHEREMCSFIHEVIAENGADECRQDTTLCK
jgi:hypothetical protein